MRALLAGLALAGAACEPRASDEHVYTLYRTSAASDSLRVHVATFDAAEGEIYNRDNCEHARHLYQQQPGVTTRFWCEKGAYRK